MARRRIAAIGLFLLAITRAWAEPQGPPPDFPKFQPNPIELVGGAEIFPRKVAFVLPERGKIAPSVVTASVFKTSQSHYVVTEWCAGAKVADPVPTGPGKVIQGSGLLGPNCYAQATAYSGTVCNLWATVSVGPLTITNPITVEWDPGEDNTPEPRGGLTLYLYHDCRSFTEAQGIGAGKVVGSAKARASARTRGPSQTCYSESQSNAPLAGADADPRGDSKVEILTSLHSGWKGFISAQVSGVAGSWIVGCAEMEATAEITWEAECSAAVESDLRKPGRERSTR